MTQQRQHQPVSVEKCEKKGGEKERERKTRHVKPMEQEKCISGAFYNVNEIYLYSNQHMHITHNTRFRTLKQFLFLFILFLSIFCLRHFFFVLFFIWFVVLGVFRWIRLAFFLILIRGSTEKGRRRKKHRVGTSVFIFILHDGNDGCDGFFKMHLSFMWVQWGTLDE